MKRLTIEADARRDFVARNANVWHRYSFYRGVWFRYLSVDIIRPINLPPDNSSQSPHDLKVNLFGNWCVDPPCRIRNSSSLILPAERKIGEMVVETGGLTGSPGKK